jgi:hypothetical protein
MKETAQIIRPWQKEEARFLCSACGAERGCDCNAPAVEKLAHKVEQQRRNQKAYRERKAALYNAPAENKEEFDGGYIGRRRVSSEEARFILDANEAIVSARAYTGRATQKDVLAMIDKVIETFTTLRSKLRSK